MKKRYMAFAVLAIGLAIASCSVDSSELDKALEDAKNDIEQAGEDMKKDLEEAKSEVQDAVPGATYQCPVDCENGPSYDAPGPCVKCGQEMEIL